MAPDKLVTPGDDTVGFVRSLSIAFAENDGSNFNR